MSALGQMQTYAAQEAMSALPRMATEKADFRKRSCLLYPQKRTCAVRLAMSAKGQQRTFAQREKPPRGVFVTSSQREHPSTTKNQSAVYEIDPSLDRHEVDDGPVLRRERLDVSSAVRVHFSERVLCALGREQDARLGKRDPSPLVRWQCR